MSEIDDRERAIEAMVFASDEALDARQIAGRFHDELTPGEVRAIKPIDASVKVPHMGWNDVALTPHAQSDPVIEMGEAYFLHSYHFHVDNGRDVIAMTDHGGGLVAAVGRDNLLGVQFHPEKSQAYGLALLERFLAWRP